MADGAATLDVQGETLTMPADGVPAAGSTVNVVVRPESIALAKSNSAAAVVQSCSWLGDKIEYEVMFAGQTLNVVCFNPAEHETMSPGTAVSVVIPPAAIRLVAAED